MRLQHIYSLEKGDRHYLCRLIKTCLIEEELDILTG